MCVLLSLLVLRVECADSVYCLTFHYQCSIVLINIVKTIYSRKAFIYLSFFASLSMAMVIWKDQVSEGEARQGNKYEQFLHI